MADEPEEKKSRVSGGASIGSVTKMSNGSEETRPIPAGGDNKFMKMMKERMGYKEGEGLGRHGQGITAPVAADGSITRHGLGHEARKHAVNDPNATWDDSVENKAVEEHAHFIECPQEVRGSIANDLTDDWIITGEPLTTLRNSVDFCDADIVDEVIDAKSVFDNLPRSTIQEARKRANPYEAVMGGIFQNRAAMKTANLDRVLEWRLSREFDKSKRLAKNPVETDVEPVNATRDENLFYFADVCAGPGGFSEYMIWRKAFYNVKGFGFTLRGNDDFKLNQFKAGSSAFFETYYGVNENGDVTNPENLRTLEKYVKKRTNGKGCHLVMCDGGFSVEGKEELQEVLSKRLYLCQFIVGLSLARVGNGQPGSGGNFLCKLFDVFTPFSAGLIYLMYSAFQRITIHKPNTSRPANSERYIFCENLTEFGATVIKKYFVRINEKLGDMDRDTTISSIFPIELIEQDTLFFDYFKKNNEDFARRQILYLNKYKEFARNKGAFDQDQSNLREDCLRYWEVPDKRRSKVEHEPATLALKPLLGGQTFPYGQCAQLNKHFDDIWKQEVKQVRLREFYAILLPEYSLPYLIVSNEQGKAFIFRNERESQELADLSLPPKTLLLVQETSLYKKDAGGIKPYKGRSSVLFVLDASRINNDDISALDYADRLRAINKFCQAVNRGIESIKAEEHRPQTAGHGKRRHDRLPEFQTRREVQSYYLHCAETVELNKLEATFDELRVSFYEEKATQLAVRSFEFPEDLKTPNETHEPLFFPCQAVRLVQRYKANYMLCWSRSQETLFLFNGNNGKHLELGKFADAIPSFFDHFPSTRDQQSSRKDLVFHWSWKMDPRNSYGPNEILNNEECNGLLTTRMLCEKISALKSGYDERVWNVKL